MSGDGVQLLRERLTRFDRLGIADLPTPLQRMSRLTDYLGGPEIWLKRDDLMGLGMGGNKLRKLDLVLQQAVDAGRDVLVSGGVVQSNSQRQVAAAAARLGLDCHLVVYHGRLEPPSAAYLSNGNTLLNRIFGAQLHETPWTGDRNAAIEDLARELATQGRRPFVVPYGVSSGLGAIAYASAALEIAEQSQALGFVPSSIVHSSGSGGTQAGLVVGAGMCLPDTSVVGIDVDDEPARVRADVLRYAAAAASLLDIEAAAESVEVVGGLAGAGYGRLDQATLEAIFLIGRLEGLVMDPVYSGKGLAGLMALIRGGRWSRADRIVLVHTGGEPALFAYGSAIDQGVL